MHDLLMRALDSAASDPVSQPHILVILHAGRVFAVITNQRVQTRAQLRRLRTQTFQPRNDLLHLAGFEIDANLADPLIGLRRAFAEAQAGKLPRMLHGVPEVENFAPADEPCGPVPDPFRAVANDHHHRVGAEPPNSRNCPYSRRKMASASPRQLTRKRRTTERRPGEVSTRSSGNSRTPVLTSRK